MPCKVTTREDDETLLRWMEMRDSGQSCGKIGAQYGVPCNRVRTATNRVYEAIKAGQ